MRPRGFTLVEVLVALMIVAIGMSAVLATLTSSAETTAYLREKSFAEWVAMNRIAELRLQVQPPAIGKSAGEAELAGQRWRWEQEVLKLDVPGTRRIDVRVRPEGGARAGNWVVTVSGIIGDAVRRPDGEVLPWARQAPGAPTTPQQPVPRVRVPASEPEPEPDPTEPEIPERPDTR
jgi:general secretion pathway protein I